VGVEKGNSVFAIRPLVCRARQDEARVGQDSTVTQDSPFKTSRPRSVFRRLGRSH
jgi:hypothetical protein